LYLKCSRSGIGGRTKKHSQWGEDKGEKGEYGRKCGERGWDRKGGGKGRRAYRRRSDVERLVWGKRGDKVVERKREDKRKEGLRVWGEHMIIEI